MKVWLFVEGPSDSTALETLWSGWQKSLRKGGWGIKIIPLQSKSLFFKKIGHRAAEKLADNENDLVVGLPDLYPNREYIDSRYKHDGIEELMKVQTELVKGNLDKIYGFSSSQVTTALDRFYPTALKHDLEMLLLAATDELRQTLNTHDALGNWRHPVEDQNQMKPPKYIVEDLFKAKKGRAYRDTVHAKVVLEKVTDIKTILYSKRGKELQCPVFKKLIDWIGTKTGVRAYEEDNVCS